MTKRLLPLGFAFLTTVLATRAQAAPTPERRTISCTVATCPEMLFGDESTSVLRGLCVSNSSTGSRSWSSSGR